MVIGRKAISPKNCREIGFAGFSENELPERSLLSLSPQVSSLVPRQASLGKVCEFCRWEAKPFFLKH